jgi:hypothetical protein
MKCKATSKGFAHGRLIYPGEVFELPDGSVGPWFKEVEAAPTAPPAPPPALPAPPAAPPAGSNKSRKPADD